MDIAHWSVVIPPDCNSNSLNSTNPDEFQKKVDTLVDDKVDDEVKGISRLQI